jgi:hypothetical protein
MDVSTYDLGPAASTPREIRELRRKNLEFHHRLGTPVIFKRRKTLEDVEKGLAVRCPYHYDIQYKSDYSRCPYCFGTTILGGFDSGIIVFVTMGDVATDQFQLTDQGLLTRMTHPEWSAPWSPPMHDDDLIILAEFDPDTYEVLSTDDRFELDQVQPVTPRGGAPVGFAKNRNRNAFNFIPKHDMLVAQNFRADLLPSGHSFYSVPILEPIHYPDVGTTEVAPPSAPLGTDPDDFNPVPPLTREVSMVMKIRGGDPGVTTPDTDVSVEFPEEYL